MYRAQFPRALGGTPTKSSARARSNSALWPSWRYPAMPLALAAKRRASASLISPMRRLRLSCFEPSRR